METGLVFFALFLTFSGISTEDSQTAVATFYTYLVPKSDGYSVRKELIPEKVASLQADVICLQQVFTGADMINITTAAQENDRFPYQYSPVHDDVSSLSDEFFQEKKPCDSYIAAAKFLLCMTYKCRNISDLAEKLKCATEKCSITTVLSQQCISCLAIADENPLKTIDYCSRESNPKINVLGLLLLSKLDLTNVSVNYYVPGVNLLMPRGHISAQVEGLGTVSCAQHTANLGDTYFEALAYDNWAAQNLDEAHKIVSYLSSSQNAVLLGTLYTSPAIAATGVSADMEESHEYYTDNGFESPYVDESGECTYCKSNPYVNKDKNYIYDHILLKGLESTSAERIFDEYQDDPLSSHYGVRVAVKTETVGR